MTPRLRLLGPFAVLRPDGPVDVGGRRARALLARLALDPGRVVGVDALVDAVWDGAPPAAPANALQAVVSRVRRAAPDLPLRARPPGYLLDLPRDAVDAGAFEDLLGRARDARDPHTVVELLTAAEALWAGDPLADLRDLAFTAAPAVRWAELRLTATEQRLTAVLELGDAAAALAELDVLTDAHPLRETLARLRVRALHRLGRPAEALAAYEQVRARLADELGLDPSPALQAEQLAVLRDDAAPASRARPVLRAPLTSFRGRQAELHAVASALDTGRLVTLLGAGGAGKTRLALEAARLVDHDVRDGVWWVELAPVADPRLLPGVVLTAVGQRESTSLERVPTLVEAGDRLREVFADRQALLVLDNCEHLVGAVAALADDLLSRCAGLRVLTTSREPLGVPGETLLPIGPLTVPADDDPSAADAPVVRLFADRAAAARPGFAVTPATLPVVLEVCRRLDGMPLALELASARLRTLGIAQIAARLDDRFTLLTGGSRVALPRHQTLRAVVEWSWDALTDDEQAVGRRLSVFSGGATLEAAEVVCAGPSSVLDAVGGLVEKSLLLAVPDESGAVRYRMLETVRAYGAEQLTAAGERDRVEAAHTAWCLDLLDRLEPLLRGAEQLGALRELHAEHDGLVAVLQREVAVGAAETAVHLAGRLCWYWLLSGRQVAAGRWLSDVLALPAAPTPLGCVCVAFSALAAAETGGWARGKEVLDEVRALPPTLTWASGEPLAAFGWALAVAFSGGPLDELAPLADHADPWVVAAVRSVVAQVAENTGVLGADGTGDLAATHEAFLELGDRWGRSLTAGALAAVRAQDGDLAGAVELTIEALALSDELGTHDDSPLLRIRLAGLRAAQGDLAGAAREIDTVLVTATRDGGPILAFAESMRSTLAMLAGRPEEALERGRLAVDSLADVISGPDQVDALVRTSLGVVLATGAATAADPAAARVESRAVLDRAMGSAADSGDMPVVAVVVHGLAVLAEAEDDPAEAARLLGVATAVRGRGDAGDPVVLALADRLRAVLGAERVAELRAQGAAVTREAALVELGIPGWQAWPGIGGRAADPGAPSRSRQRPAPPVPG
ncbi:hypothetical protein ASG41_20250 [Modestobacter sp. Leaf380]|nr:hypothetical protein ASG41_20250 [Modestobacter sp. Leaf380]